MAKQKTGRKYFVRSVTFDKETLAKADSIAKATERNRSQVIRHLIRTADQGGNHG